MKQWRLKRQNMRRYNLTAHLYNSRYIEEQNDKIEEILGIIELNSKCSILDIGCGTGLLFPYLGNHPHITVGLDLSKQMLEKAKHSTRSKDNVHLILADADYIPLRELSFNVILAITLLQNMPDGAQTLQETKRVMTANAKLVVTGLVSYFTEEEFSQLLERTGFQKILVLHKSTRRFHVAVCEK